MDDYRCHNCDIPLDYNNEFGWILYVEGPRRCVYLNYCPNCGARMDKTSAKSDTSDATREALRQMLIACGELDKDDTD